MFAESAQRSDVPVGATHGPGAGLRVLHVIRSLDPAGGGPQEGLRQIAREMATRSVHVEIVSLDDPGAPWGANYHVPVHLAGPALGKYGYSGRFGPWLRTHAGRFDIVVIHGLWQFHGFAAWRELRRQRIPYVVYPHGMLDPWFKREYPLKHLKKWLYWPWADYRMTRDAHAVLFTCEEESILAPRSFWLYRGKPEVVGFGIAPPPADTGKQRLTFLDRFPELRGKRLLLFMARIHPKKGCDLLIEAFARAAARDPALQLVMAGPDQIGWQNELAANAAQRGISGRISWVGMLGGDDKWGAFRSADAFVLPSHQENFGIAVVEAMACGLPVLISDQVNIWREIEADGGGLVEPDDLDGTVRLLHRWLDLSTAQRDAMRERAREGFQSRFLITASTTRLIAVLSTAARLAAPHG